jgi:hypothetical protein
MVLLQELQSVEFAMKKLESLVKESETSGVACGREKLSAACSDLEKIRSLKREVEALEAALKSKAGLKERLVLKQQVRCSCGLFFWYTNRKSLIVQSPLSREG